MDTMHHFSMPVSVMVVAGLLSLNFYVPTANAGMIGTNKIIQTTQAQQERSQIQDAINRKEVSDKLAALGVDRAQLQARVNALTDEEAAQLAEHIDTLPAGSGVWGILLFIFVLLLITDLLGFTNVFPFTNKGSAKP